MRPLIAPLRRKCLKNPLRQYGSQAAWFQAMKEEHVRRLTALKEYGAHIDVHVVGKEDVVSGQSYITCPEDMLSSE